MNILRKPLRYNYNSAVYYLIGITVLVYLAQMMFRHVTIYLAMIPDLVMRGWVWQLLTYMFVHSPQGFTHILFNMLGLFIFGIQVERRMGSNEFILFYLVTGTMAGIVSFLMYYFTGTSAILLGASGALYGVMLAFAVYFPDAIIYIWGIIPMRAPVMVVSFTALALFFSFTGMQRSVAHLTHLSGFAAAWLYFLIRFGINPWRALRGR